MSDLTNLIKTVETTLHQIANQASKLGVGLQNVAPGKAPLANSSVEYLLYTAANIEQIAEEVESLTPRTKSSPNNK